MQNVEPAQHTVAAAVADVVGEVVVLERAAMTCARALDEQAASGTTL
jgi:hypothetical protein